MMTDYGEELTEAGLLGLEDVVMLMRRVAELEAERDAVHATSPCEDCETLLEMSTYYIADLEKERNELKVFKTSVPWEWIEVSLSYDGTAEGRNRVSAWLEANRPKEINE